VSFKQGENTNASRDVHRSKQESPRNATNEGKKMDLSDEQPKKAFDSIRCNFESDSNDILLRESQYLKHETPRISTSEGMQIAFNGEQYAKLQPSIRRS
jgi:hypothetical protein